MQKSLKIQSKNCFNIWKLVIHKKILCVIQKISIIMLQFKILLNGEKNAFFEAVILSRLRARN